MPIDNKCPYCHHECRWITVDGTEHGICQSSSHHYLKCNWCLIDSLPLSDYGLKDTDNFEWPFIDVGEIPFFYCPYCHEQAKIINVYSFKGEIHNHSFLRCDYCHIRTSVLEGLFKKSQSYEEYVWPEVEGKSPEYKRSLYELNLLFRKLEFKLNTIDSFIAQVGALIGDYKDAAVFFKTLHELCSGNAGKISLRKNRNKKASSKSISLNTESEEVERALSEANKRQGWNLK